MAGSGARNATPGETEQWVGDLWKGQLGSVPSGSRVPSAVPSSPFGEGRIRHPGRSFGGGFAQPCGACLGTLPTGQIPL